MKKIVYSLAVLSIVIVAACNKNIDEENSFTALSPAKADSDAGAWKPVLITSFDSFTVAAPAPINAPGYIAEVNEIKSWQHNITAAQKETIKYWSAGAVLRWNEILRELVARHNIPPYQNDDGTYPFPSAANPFAYPTFPFANPPYAARAYAYVCAAQYDALIAAYHFKQLYKRAAPYTIEGVQALVPKSTLSSYPSEDATVEGVTVELLKLLFPADLSFIQQKADEHKLYRIMAGANVRSDIDAGEALGKAVAQKFTARARTDKAGAAIGTAAIWADMETKIGATGETPWISQESPKRPPMLPLFGKVKTFLFDSAALVSIRPAPPASVKSEEFKKQLAEVKWYSEHYDNERMRVVSFWADGINTYTPPGHWNAIAAEAFASEGYSEVRWARNFALLNMAMMDAAVACWDTKYLYFTPRASQLDPSIKTLTGLPNFPSYTSGHSTFSGAAATILGYLIPAQAERFNAMASEASMSRLYGAIHYRMDCEQGLLCGQRVGAFAINRAKSDGAN